MADFKTTLERLSRREIEFDAVAANLDKLLRKQPQAAVVIMDQLKEAVTEEVIDAETYARLRARVARHVEAAPLGGRDGGDERTRFAGDDSDDSSEILDITSGDTYDPTRVERTPPGVDDATEVVDGTAAATPMSGQTSGIDFDLGGDSGTQTSSSWPTGGTDTGQTGTDWAQPAAGAATTRLGPGGVLRGRFKLNKVLGQGGMGAVYLGEDLIKVRAKDKKPEVALKVLNEDFKQHPDSFIALQREASRQQKLAHPNIATVYDFDQTEDGLAFLVMEVLDGEPLNDFIKKQVKPKGGLPFAEAFPMVQGLGNALIYAHERSIVHSDFKPGNCFVTKEGQMKVLDFGIARAVKAPGAAEGETTIFDPGKLGALTPAYASLEMLEGEEPDPRDDIYALACVAYELLTGKHPFNKIPANKARDAGLSPEPVKGLTRKQWRGLQRGLAFLREDRSQSTAQFLEEFEGATSPWRNPFVMVPAITALIVIAGFFPAKNYLENRDIEARIALAKSGDPAQIERMLDGLQTDGIAADKRDRIFTAAKDEIIVYFENRARDQFAVDKGHYDFTGARRTVEQAKALSTVYKDSSALAELERNIQESENRLFNEQFEKFNTALENGALLAVDGEDDIFDAMNVVRQVDPKHPMLTDRRIPGAYAAAINTALENEDYDYADELGQVGLGLIPDSANLANLTDKIAGARDRAQTRARILTAIAAIRQAEDADAGLAGYVDVAGAIADLARADPGNELLEKLRARIEPLATKDLAALERSKDWGKSALMGGDYKALLRGLGLHDLNARAESLGDEFENTLSAARGAVTEAVASGDIAPRATAALDQLAAVAPRSDRTQNARDQVAKAFLQRAYAARDAGQYDVAGKALAAAAAVAPRDDVSALLDAEQARVAAERGLDDAAREAARAQRQARFDERLAAVRAETAALGTDPDAYDTALAGLDELEALAPAAPALDELRGQLAQAVTNGARRMGEAGQWDAAVAVTRRALIDLPSASGLSASLAELESERREFIVEQEKQLVADAKRDIEQLLQNPTADRDWRASVRQKMEDIIALGEPDDPWLAENGKRIARTYIERAAEMRGEQRFAEGANLLADAERFAPDAPGLADERAALTAATEAFEREQAEQARLARIDGLKETFQTQARANDVGAAQKTLDALRGELGNDQDPFVEKEAPRMLAAAYYKLATQRAAATDFAAALRFAKACAELQPQRLDCKNAVRDYTVDGNKQDLEKIFARGGNFDLGEAMSKISEVQILDPGVFSRSEGQWAEAIGQRLEGLKESAGTGANEVIEQAKQLFAGNQLIAAIAPVKLEVAPSRYAAEVNAAMDKALLGEARDLLKKASATEGEHPDIVRLKAAFNARVGEAKELFETYKAQYTDGDYEDALATMEKALTVWADSNTFKKEHARVVAKINEQAVASDGTPASRVIAAALPPTDPCDSRLAGHGKRRKGTCFYFVSGNQRGPLMVVVPKGGEFARPYAIGKYEVTVADYNRYCVLSGSCEPRRDVEGRQPITGISIEDAQAYVAWLSERTGQHFRLPTVSEWAYAAEAGGDQPKKDYNCRLEQGGQLLKGQGTMGVNTGKPNGWGLYNYVGNVQEWATSGNGVVARGGAFEDTFGKCDITLEKNHDGQPDEATGFRVVMDLG
ncbi:MAG: protein kinase [Gammaproteobacteria bacterium]|nr:protein kinase [Gammaproteobacteria bacterium]